MDVPISTIFFGRTGEGKSTLANMLVQEDLRPENNTFPIGNGAVGETAYITYCHNEKFEVYDTIGLCESSEGTVSHKAAIKKIRHYFSKVQSPLHYICYVKKGGKFTKEDKSTFREFEKVFKGGEKNFVIIITDSTPKWTSENAKTIRDYFGNYQVISVDFPFSDRYPEYLQQGIRKSSREHLTTSLLSLTYNGVKLEVLKPSEEIESRVANIVGFVPVVGTVYKLLSSGVYTALKRPELARSRLIEGLNGGDARAIMTLFGADVKLIKY